MKKSIVFLIVFVSAIGLYMNEKDAPKDKEEKIAQEVKDKTDTSTVKVKSKDNKNNKKIIVETIKEEYRGGSGGSGMPMEKESEANLGALNAFNNLPLGKEIISYYSAVNTLGENSEERMQERLDELKKNSAAATKSLYEGYNALEAEHYNERWIAIQTISEIADPSSFVPLTTVVQENIPAEVFQNTHHYSSVDEERMIKMAALDGLGKLAKKGITKVDKFLLETAINEKDISVLRGSINAYLEVKAEQESRIAVLKKNIDPKYHDLITTKVSAVSMIQDEAFDKQHAESMKSVSSHSKDHIHQD